MSAEVTTQTQTRTADSAVGTGKRGSNRPRGGNTQERGVGNANRRPNRNSRGTNNKDKATAAPTLEKPVGNAPGDAIAVQAEAVVAPPLSESGDLDVCFICAEPVKYYSVSACNHRTCHVCAIRLRALYKKMDCTFCKDPQTSVIFTASPDALFSSFTPDAMPYKDSKLSVYFETQEMMEDTLILLRFNCPDPECDYIGNGWGDLRLHVRAVHGKLMCDICIRHKKVFSHEHAIYPQALLAVHLPSMNQRPSKAALKETIPGGVHPLCAFCRECFFGDDELYAHMRERHEECFICKRNEVRDQYFQDYESLERHFDNAHFPCTQTECQARKFVVFNTALDLKAHTVEEHGGDMSARDKKEAMRIQAEFTFEEVGHTGRHGQGRRDRERDRDRDRERGRDREPPPAPPPRPPPQQASSSAAATPPPGSGSRRREAFGGGLTQGETGPGSGNNTRGASRPSSPPAVADLDPAVVEKHAGFLNRLQSLAANPAAAVPAVKAATRGYRSAESTARDLILTIWNVLDRNLEHTASIVNAFVDLLDEEDKKQDLLTSWKGFAVEQRRQFPELVPTSLGSEYSGITSGRVLNAKHSTAIRSPQQSSQQQVWNRVALAASSSSTSSSHLPPPRKPADRFPALGGGVSSGSATAAPTPQFRQGQRSTPWSGSSAPPSTLRSQTAPQQQPVSIHAYTSSAKNSRSSTLKQPPPKLSNSLFPELPTSSSARSKPQVKGNVSLRNILGSTPGPVVPAWQASGDGSAPAPEGSGNSTVGNNEGGGGGKGKKGKGKQKQTLFTLGSFPT